MKLDKSFYTHDDVVSIAKNLLGKKLCTYIDGIYTSGKIVEAEAYHGRMDRACHAFNRRTPRTEIMYKEGGHAYVYLCYGIHYLFNVVTNIDGVADAVLIRALEPVEGINYMLQRRKMVKAERRLTSGPGTLTIALGIGKKENGLSLLDDKIWIEEYEDPDPRQIIATTRIGVDYAGEDSLLPWRFYIANNEWISKK
jgi:DNA-3-methyladenine glycosylase